MNRSQKKMKKMTKTSMKNRKLLRKRNKSKKKKSKKIRPKVQTSTRSNQKYKIFTAKILVSLFFILYFF